MQDEIQDDIFDADPGKPVKRTIQRKDYYFRILSAAELEASEKIPDPPTTSEMFALTVSLTLCDKAGNLIATDPQAIVKRMSGRRLVALFKAAKALNRISPEAVDAEKKDSAATPG